ncbi:hypothetical protein JCM30471_35840 [Desulfuromonas carbonis]|uniref:RluA family pseudouridine synthase n=1 Tax=Desulfuromonas sp. DDH964 TaxID=1823759 RepID=UPI00078B661E|nr:RNA pseudouridine synthase [Desulfuromonas sp. DDH964]AMV72940.1 23S rRNA synthase [Desulfuromonas sp. DDH964]
MAEQTQGKKPPKLRRPGGMEILYEDRDILVVVKPAGLLTIGSEREKRRTAHYLLNDYVRKGDPKSRHRVFVVHRLDQETSGLLLFARSEAVKTFLQQDWETTEKHYVAVVHGAVSPAAGTISSCLAENRAQRVYSTTEPGQGKLAHTAYRVLQQGRGCSLLDIHLLTGRKHQIRVHFAELGHPLVGDRKYGADSAPRLALHARSLTFTHPGNGRLLSFDTGIPEELVRLLGRP